MVRTKIFTFLHFCSLKRRNRQNKRNKATMKLRTHPSKHHAHPACVCFNMFNVSSTVPQDNNFHHMSPSKREWGEEERFFISIVSSIIPPMQYWVHGPPRGHERWWPGRHQYDSSLASVGSKKLRRRRRDPEVLVFAHSLHVGKYVTRYAHESDEEGQLILTFQH